jgi:hypothetical protein
MELWRQSRLCTKPAPSPGCGQRMSRRSVSICWGTSGMSSLVMAAIMNKTAVFGESVVRFSSGETAVYHSPFHLQKLYAVFRKVNEVQGRRKSNEPTTQIQTIDQYSTLAGPAGQPGERGAAAALPVRRRAASQPAHLTEVVGLLFFPVGITVGCCWAGGGKRWAGR